MEIFGLHSEPIGRSIQCCLIRSSSKFQTVKKIGTNLLELDMDCLCGLFEFLSVIKVEMGNNPGDERGRIIRWLEKVVLGGRM